MMEIKSINEFMEQYESKIIEWDMYTDDIKPTIYLLGAYGELGETVDKILDYFEKFGKIKKRQMKLALEIGDVYWYLIRFTNSLGFSWQQVMKIKVKIKNKGTVKNILKVYVELGKISNDFKKVFRDHEGRMEKNQMEYAEKLSKLFKYLDLFLNQIGFTFQEVIEMNYEKLDSRFKRGKIKGAGDSR